MDALGSAEEFETGPGLLEAVWQYRLLVTVVTIIAAVLGYGAALLQPVQYESVARLLLADPRNAGVFLDTGRVTLDPARYVRNQAELVTSTPVAIRAAELLDGQVSAEEITAQVTAQPSIDLDLITIRALAPAAEDAARLADAVAEGYQQVTTEDVRRNAEQAVAELTDSTDQLQARIDATELSLSTAPDNTALQAERDGAIAQLIQLQARAEQIAVDAALYGSGVELFEEAEVPGAPAQPQPLRNAAVATVLGLLAASAFAWWRAEHTQSAERRQDAAAVLRAPLLGEVPEFGVVGVTGSLPTITSRNSAPAESYQFIVASLEFALAETGGSSILLTSASAGDGKTVTAINLAVAAAQDGRQVMLVDADERMRGLTRLTKASAGPGLTDLADAELPFEGCVSIVRLSERVRLPFISAGSKVADPAGFFRTPGFRKAVMRIKDRADFVVIDSPPLLAVADTSAIAAQFDGIVVVVTRGTPMRLLEDLRARLDFVGTPVLGYVFNRTDPRGSRYGYRYGYRYGAGYGYGYGYGAEPHEKVSLLRRMRRRTPAAGEPNTEQEAEQAAS